MHIIQDDGDSEESRSSRLKRLASVIHLFILSELGCASRSNDKNRNKMKTKSSKPHFGLVDQSFRLVICAVDRLVIFIAAFDDRSDMLAEMQVCIDELLAAAEKARQAVSDNAFFNSYDYSSDEDTTVSENREVTRCVRKRFSIALRKILEHGCCEVSWDQHYKYRSCWYQGATFISDSLCWLVLIAAIMLTMRLPSSLRSAAAMP